MITDEYLRGYQSRVVFQQGKKQLHSLDSRNCSAVSTGGRFVAAGAATAAADVEPGA